MPSPAPEPPATPFPCWIDTDAGADDAVALLAAFGDPRLEIVGISVVAGNVPLAQAVQNVLYLVERAGVTTPVYAGAAGPLHRSLHSARHVHGRNGFGDADLPLQGRRAADESAVGALLASSHAHAGELVVVALGPLTNLAHAVLRDPTLRERVRRLVFMGGTSDLHGNVTQVAEYNVWADPDAAAIVCAAGLPLTAIGWDVSRRWAVFTEDDVRAVRRLGEMGQLAMHVQNRQFDYQIDGDTVVGFDLPDALAVGIAAEPAIASETVQRAVHVDLGHGPTRGQTTYDHRRTSGSRPDVDLVLAADRQRFVRWLHDSLGALA